MTRNTCNHPVFPGLRAKLTAANITVCPMCLVRLHVFGIAETQAALERRGGIFASRATAIAAQDTDNKQDVVIHRTLLRRWRLAKIDLYRDLSLLENLRTDGTKKSHWELQLNKAFELWKEVEDECSRVPGYRYSKIDDCRVSEEMSDVEQDVSFTFKRNEDIVVDESEDESKELHAVKRKARTTKQCSPDTRVSLVLVMDPAEVVSTEDVTHYGSNLEVQSPDRTAPPGIESVPSKMERDSYWDSRNRYDLPREIDIGENPNMPNGLENHIPPLPVFSQDEDCTTASTTQRPPQKSSLKRKRSSKPSEKIVPKGKIHIAERVTVICDASACDTTGLPPEHNSYKRPHFLYITAETARMRRNFYRRSALYMPYTWALPDGYENVNTSHYKTPWELYDAIQLLADIEE